MRYRIELHADCIRRDTIGKTFHASLRTAWPHGFLRRRVKTKRAAFPVGNAARLHLEDAFSAVDYTVRSMERDRREFSLPEASRRIAYRRYSHREKPAKC